MSSIVARARSASYFSKSGNRSMIISAAPAETALCLVCFTKQRANKALTPTLSARGYAVGSLRISTTPSNNSSIPQIWVRSSDARVPAITVSINAAALIRSSMEESKRRCER
uniref:Uncharacterized protein n=1 Tax=Cucumis sativus TaxID=3659 RepID=A0A0A0LBX9_CUCSA